MTAASMEDRFWRLRLLLSPPLPPAAAGRRSPGSARVEQLDGGKALRLRNGAPMSRDQPHRSCRDDGFARSSKVTIRTQLLEDTTINQPRKRVQCDDAGVAASAVRTRSPIEELQKCT